LPKTTRISNKPDTAWIRRLLDNGDTGT
jgi:hypothetical protein